MQKRPTYEELEQRVKESEKETIRRKKAEEALRKNEKRLKALLAELTAKNEELDSFVYRLPGS
jgi:hypothetical protein